MQNRFSVRRLGQDAAALFTAVRQEMFRDQPREFRFAPTDEKAIPQEQVSQRLDADYVVAAFSGVTFSGIGGFSRFSGAKLSHKGLIWGMYVRPAMRGTGAANALMKALIDHAMTVVESVALTVIASNLRAVRFYERWGFRVYGSETQSVKIGAGDYLDEHLMARSFAFPRALIDRRP